MHHNTPANNVRNLHQPCRDDDASPGGHILRVLMDALSQASPVPDPDPPLVAIEQTIDGDRNVQHAAAPIRQCIRGNQNIQIHGAVTLNVQVDQVVCIYAGSTA